MKTVREITTSIASSEATKKRITFKDSVDDSDHKQLQQNGESRLPLGDHKSKIGGTEDSEHVTFLESQLTDTEDLDSLLTESDSKIGNICSDSDEESTDDDEDRMVKCLFPIIPPVVNMVTVRTTHTPRQNIL